MTKALKMQRLLSRPSSPGVSRRGHAVRLRVDQQPGGGAVTTAVTLADAGDSLLARAFAEHTSDVEVEGRGR